MNHQIDQTTNFVDLNASSLLESSQTQTNNPHSFDLIVLGGTGDLAWRKLMPALFQSFRHHTLPIGGRIIGVARDQLSDQEYRELIQSRLQSIESSKCLNMNEFSAFAQMLHYLPMDLSRSEDYLRLAQLLKERSAQTVVIYAATAPSLFSVVCEQLKAAHLNTENTRIVLEKPLGHDLASNKQINQIVRQAFEEKQIFRIDHYLGKPSVQNLFALRFGNVLFEPLWRRETIANIQITIAESLGVEKRGNFYDSTGALRDMVQNHALQLLCAIAMEPPINAHADAIRDEKLKVLRSLKPWTPERLSQHLVRGQYSAGVIDGSSVAAYAEETGVHPESKTETFVALRAEIENWRWAGVPFYVRTGKRLAAQEAHIVINFRPAPHPIFTTPLGATNRLVINLQPHDGLELHLLAEGQNQHQRNASNTKNLYSKKPLQIKAHQPLAPVQLDLDFEKRFGRERVGAYERLLLDVLEGRLNLFVRSDEQQEAWRWVQPILEDWEQQNNANINPRPYAAGTWGPGSASTLIARDGFCWSEEN